MGQTITVVLKLWDESRPPKPKWTATDIPDLSGKVTIVTGGYTGIGLETVRALLSKNAKVYIAGRNKSKADNAINVLKNETGKEVLFIELDLADLKAVKKAAEEFKSKETQLHILFNSGGVMVPPVDQLTADGYDLQFGTNVLGHFYFTKLLLPVLLETAKSAPDKHVRVVTSSSSGHLFQSGPIQYDTLRDSSKRKKLGITNLYEQSKFGNILFAKELAKRYADQGIVSTSLDPGIIKSELGRHISSFQKRIMDLMLFPTPMGAITQLYAGTAPEAADLNGAHLIPWARVGEPLAHAKDPKEAEELWNWLEEQVKDI
ncbi:RDH1_1 [Sanghuangporus weigelae]